MNIIQVKRLADFPTEPLFACDAKSLADVEKWAQRLGADTVWTYHRKFGQELYTAVTLVSQTAEWSHFETSPALGFNEWLSRPPRSIRRWKRGS